jgi:DNA-binding transcriptional MerR regulator
MSGLVLFSLKDVQRALHVPRWRILYLYESGQLAEPMRVGGHRLFSEEDVRQIANKFGIALDNAVLGRLGG